MSQNQNPPDNNNNNEQNARNKEGKHIKSKGILIIIAIILFFFIYNIFKEKPAPVRSDSGSEEETITTSQNPFDTGYIERTPPLQNNNAPTEEMIIQERIEARNNFNEELARRRMEELQKAREREERAKNSPISFRGIMASSSSGNSSSQSDNEIPEMDYDGNRQASKRNFIHNEKAPSFYSRGILIPALSPYEVKAGDFIPAIMQGAINSDLPSRTIVALVRENVYDSLTGNHLLIPQGTRIQGTYDSNVTFGQNRLLVIWQRLILPNGKSIELANMQGVDLSGRVGMTGKVNNHFGTLLKGVVLSSIAGAAGGVVTSDSSNAAVRNASTGAGEQIVRIGDRYAERALSRQPTIDIAIGARFNIMVHSDLILEPYRR